MTSIRAARIIRATDRERAAAARKYRIYDYRRKTIAALLSSDADWVRDDRRDALDTMA